MDTQNTTKKHSLVCKVAANKMLCGDWRQIEITAPEIAETAVPGQFVQLRSWTGGEPLLRRPFSIQGVSRKKDRVKLLLRVVGPGTRLIASTPPGASVDIIGPLGNGFPPPEKTKIIWVVAGGTGVAPFLFMINAFPGANLKFFYGARTAVDCGALSLLPPEAIITTESGDAGMSGLVTEALAIGLSDTDREPDAIYACGPIPMMAHVHNLAKEAGIPCHVSLEAHMGCGFGACLGCVVPGAGVPYRHVCADGPVFDSRQIDWHKLLNTRDFTGANL